MMREIRLEDTLEALAFYDCIAAFAREHVYNTYFLALVTE
jgi:hypothetical protein